MTGQLTRSAVFAAAGALFLAGAPETTNAQEELSGIPLYSGEQIELLREVESARNDFIEAYAAANLEGMMAAYADNATFAGTLQPFWLDGRAAIEDLWTRYIAVWPDAELKFRQPVVRFYNDTTVVETGYMEMYMDDGPEKRAPVVTDIRYSITRVRFKEGWLIANMHVSRLPKPR